MFSIRSVLTFALLALGTACSDDVADMPASGAEPSPAPETAQARQGPARAPSVTQRRIGNGQAIIDGPLASDRDFQMPSAGGVGPRVGVAAHSATLDVDTVRLALMEGLPTSGSGIEVQVTPRGIVSLRGEVGSIADLQRAHYLVRALPGVSEVDFEGLRVR